MKVRCFKGYIKEVRTWEDNSCRVDVDLIVLDGKFHFCLEIDQKALEIINNNLEEVKKINPHAELSGSKANIYFFKKDVKKLEIRFNKLYSISFPCKIKETSV